jgi:putative hemolysin
MITLRSPDLIACALLCLSGVVASQSMASTPSKSANPASTNCIEQGGSLTFETDGSGGQFGVCTFTDNLQCEEWALLHGECRAGGVKVTGYITPAGRYCAITGGHYAVVAGSSEVEQGVCSFKDGQSCPADDYFAQRCTQQQVASPGAPPQIIHASFQCQGGKSVKASFNNANGGSVDLQLSDGRELSLPQALSASGARYANADETIVFWNKGNTAFIEEMGKQSYSDCTTTP